jgi:hypothetical protein
MKQSPYAKYLAGKDAVASLESNSKRIAAIVGAWSPRTFNRTYAPGKWTGRQILVHLAQSEMVFSNRLRFGLAHDGYVIQPFDQDPWMEAEAEGKGRTAFEAYLAIRRMNLQLLKRLTPKQRARRFTHPEYGTIDVNWVITMFAGHEINHVPQLAAIK